MDRKHMNKRLMSALLAALCLTGCVKEKEAQHQPGNVIAFSASTGYENGILVRTEYSGSIVGVGSKDYERIDWVPEKDRIRVLCEASPDGPWADYVISSKSDAAQKSLATSIVPCSGYGLHWGEGDHYFYSLYPAAGTQSNYAFSSNVTVTESMSSIEKVTGNKAKIKGSIPAAQEAYFISRSTSGESFDEYKPNMNFAYMAAAKKVSTSGSTASVLLAFNPLVTTFEFTLGSVASDPLPAGKKLTKVELKSENSTLAGSFETTLSEDNTHSTPASQTDWTNSISISLGEGVTLATDHTVKFTFLTLPVDQTKVTLVLYFGDNEFKRTLELKDNGAWLTVPACQKVYITNVGVPGHVLEYHFAHTGTTIALGDADGTLVEEVVLNSAAAGVTGTAPFTTYKTQDGGVNKTPVSISGEYEYAAANDDGTPVVDTDNKIVWNSGLPTELSGLAITTTTTERTFAAGVKANSSPTIDWFISELLEHAKSLKARTPVASNKDLSMYEVDNLDTPRSSGKPTTANCYVVDRPGTYRFPVVYGNAVDYTREGGAGAVGTHYINGVNGYSYEDGDPHDNQINVWHRFQRFDESAIQSPLILSDLGLSTSDVEAVLVWEDVPSATYSFIQNVSLTTVSSSLFYDPKSGAYVTDVPYIQFEVPVGAIDTDESKTPSARVTGIRQGNALIALRRKSDNTILWSWHIWVTDGFDTDGDYQGDTMAPVTMQSRTSTAHPTKQVMPVNLGWCDDNEYTGYKDRIWYVRIKQSEGNGTPKKLAFKVVQKTPDKTVFHSGGTFYQYGRKDPFLPGRGDDTENKAAYSPIGLTLTVGVDGVSYVIMGAGYNLGSAKYAIQNPTVHYLAASDDLTGYGNGWMRDCVPVNLWNMTARLDAAGDPIPDDDLKVCKTVYDPCPPRYAVPNNHDFTIATTNGRKVWYWYQSNPERLLFNVKDLNGDGKLTDEDYDMAHGWYVYANDSHTATVFFPATGFREWNPNVGIAQFKASTLGSWTWLTGTSHAWLSAAEESDEGNVTAALRVTKWDIDPHPGYTRSYGYSIRPVMEL